MKKLNMGCLVFFLFSLLLVSCSPSQFSGNGEDDALKVTVHATLEPETANYKVEFEFTNKTDQAIGLLYNCGTISWSNNPKSSTNGDACLAVQSMSLKENSKEIQTFIFPKSFLVNSNSELILKYQLEKMTKTKEIAVKLYAKE
ncbi:hypothetical protein J2T17_004417 [Paenibacillus mucilaginosus]|uniref:hypothetical protein n=1 Tax=Paenibacillus mucilaginosus TaxID=61624 RepID=UPI003D230375